MKIYQLVNTLVRGDAIGNNVFAMNKVLKEYDINTKIFACNIGQNIKDSDVNVINKIPKLESDDVIIYHLCEASIINDMIKKMQCRKIAIYHNMTPAHFFERFDIVFSFMQKIAREHIRNLKNTFDLCIADSQFNKDDLIDLGYDSSKINVMPLIIPTYEYTMNMEEISNYYDDVLTNILFVGRIVPNKKQEDIIRIFAYYKKYINNRSRLTLVGSPFTQDYLKALEEYIKDLKIPDVEIKQSISFNDIKRLYKSADIFLCMSEHEGFCVPLVEAMLFDVPIIAYDKGAVSETLGKDGILLDTKEPCVVANLIKKVTENKNLKDYILQYQHERVKYFDYELSIKRFDDIIKKFLNH